MLDQGHPLVHIVRHFSPFALASVPLTLAVEWCCHLPVARPESLIEVLPMNEMRRNDEQSELLQLVPQKRSFP
jgi:hypothetical protein